MGLGDENKAMTDDSSFFFSQKRGQGFPQALTDVIKERSKQEIKWGEQNHEYPLWLVILMEEIGEASKDFLDSNFGGSDDGQCGSKEEYRKNKLRDHREELVQVAAVALAMIESFDRNNK